MVVLYFVGIKFSWISLGFLSMIIYEVLGVVFRGIIFGFYILEYQLVL